MSFVSSFVDAEEVPTTSFRETILSIPVADWVKDDLFTSKLHRIPKEFENEQHFTSVVAPFVFEEMRAKLHKTVGDEWKLLPNFHVWKCELYAEAPSNYSRGPLCRGVLWVPKVDEAQTVKWAKQQGPLSVALIGADTRGKFSPMYSLLVVNVFGLNGKRDGYNGKSQHEVVRWLRERKQAEDGFAFEIELLSKHLADFAKDGEIMRGEASIVFLREMIIPSERIYEAVHRSCVIAHTVLHNSVQFARVTDRLEHARDALEEMKASLNPSQQLAVEKAVTYGHALHMIKGPPGTGKTKTLVALLRVLQTAGLRVHVCAPTNAAIGELARRFFDVCHADGHFRRAQAVFFAPFQDSSTEGESVEETTEEEEREVLDPALLPFSFDGRQARIESVFKTFRVRVEEIMSLLSTFKYIGMQGEDSAESAPVSTPDPQAVARNISTKWKDVVETFMAFMEECPAVKMDAVIVAREKASTMFFQASEVETALKTAFEMQIGHVAGSVERLSADTCIETFRQECLYVIQAAATAEADLGRKRLHREVFNAAQVVFSTVNVGGRSVFRDADFDYVVIDEAGQLVLAETMIVLNNQSSSLRVVLAGDDMQLPATVISPHSNRLAYNDSLMQRLLQQDYPISLLNVQYRMHPEISRWPNARFYNGELEDGDNVRGDSYRKPWHTRFPPFNIVEIRGQEEDVDSSFCNQAEQEAVKMVVNQLKQCHTESALSIGIISPYRMQVKALKVLEQQHGNASATVTVKVATVDSFQGQECDVIIFSAVRANAHGNIGFLSDFRRLNVALTRAKYCLVVLCHVPTVRRHELWASLLSRASITNSVHSTAATNSTATDRVHEPAGTTSTSASTLVTIARRSEARFSAFASRVTSFLEATESRLFEDAQWKLHISEDFKKHVEAVTPERRQQLIVSLLRLVYGHWPKHFRVSVALDPRLTDIVVVFLFGTAPVLHYLWSVDIDRTQRKQIMKLWDIGKEEAMVKTMRKVAAYYLRHTDAYLDCCALRQQQQEAELGENGRPVKGAKVIHPFDFHTMKDEGARTAKTRAK